MAFNFTARGTEEAFSLPQDVRDWLPRRHLCRKVLEVVKDLDLSGFPAGYRVDGRGRPAYHPAMMPALVLYCYSKGIRSSRRIETACLDDVGCRIIMANRKVDHATVARFLHRHRQAVKELFVQVPALCVRQGLVDVAAVAVDGSPMHANAGRDANLCLDRLEAVIAQVEADIEGLMEEIAEDALRAEGMITGQALERAQSSWSQRACQVVAPGRSARSGPRGPGLAPPSGFTAPVTFFVAPDQGAVVAGSGMTDAPSRAHDPGGGVTGPGGIAGPLIGTRPPAGQVSS